MLVLLWIPAVYVWLKWGHFCPFRNINRISKVSMDTSTKMDINSQIYTRKNPKNPIFPILFLMFSHNSVDLKPNLMYLLLCVLFSMWNWVTEKNTNKTNIQQWREEVAMDLCNLCFLLCACFSTFSSSVSCFYQGWVS